MRLFQRYYYEIGPTLVGRVTEDILSVTDAVYKNGTSS